MQNDSYKYVINIQGIYESSEPQDGKLYGTHTAIKRGKQNDRPIQFIVAEEDRKYITPEQIYALESSTRACHGDNKITKVVFK